MISHYRKMAARCNSDLFREVTQTLCNGWKSPEIQNRQYTMFLSIQDEVTTSSHCNGPILEVYHFSTLQLPDCKKLRSKYRKPVLSLTYFPLALSAVWVTRGG